METATTKGTRIEIGEGLAVYKVRKADGVTPAERKAINQANTRTLRKAGKFEHLWDQFISAGSQMGDTWLNVVVKSIESAKKAAEKAAEKATAELTATAEAKTADVVNVAALVNAAKTKTKTAEPSEAASTFGAWKTPTAKRCETLAAKVAAMIEGGDRDGLQVLAVDLGDGAVIAESAGYGQTAATLAAFAQHCRDEAKTM